MSLGYLVLHRKNNSNRATHMHRTNHAYRSDDSNNTYRTNDGDSAYRTNNTTKTKYSHLGERDIQRLASRLAVSGK